jgi:membrane-bound lytic murein transglycosylase D
LKHYQTFLLLCVVFTLIGFTTYSKLSEKTELSYEPHSRYQVYSVELPEVLTFAGEVVPLEDRDILERFDREMNINAYWHSNTVIMMKRANRWFPEIEAILKQYNLPRDFKYVPIVESMLENAVSPKGASGYWQIMEATAKELGLEVTEEVDERFHPIKSTHAACKYFKRTYRQYGSYTNALASYNIGIGGLNRAMQAQKQKSYYNLLLNSETSRYIFRVLAVKELMEHPDKYGFRIPKKQLYKKEKIRTVKITSTVDDLAAYAIQQGINYKILKQYNPWLRKNTLTVAEGKEYIIEMPVNPVFDKSMEERAVLPDSMRLDSVASDTSSFKTNAHLNKAERELKKAVMANLEIRITENSVTSVSKEANKEALAKAGAEIQKPVSNQFATDKSKNKQVADASSKVKLSKKEGGATTAAKFKKQIEHIVRRRETIADIAETHKVKEADIKNWNNLTNNNIRKGQKLILHISLH